MLSQEEPWRAKTNQDDTRWAWTSQDKLRRANPSQNELSKEFENSVVWDKKFDPIQTHVLKQFKEFGEKNMIRRMSQVKLSRFMQVKDVYTTLKMSLA